MMIAAFFAIVFINGQAAVFVLLTSSLPQHLQLFPQLHSPFLQQHSPPLAQSHLFSLQQLRLLSHFSHLQQDASLQHFESLQHFPSLQQSSIEQLNFTSQHFPRR
jgi:hypothetical protein